MRFKKGQKVVCINKDGWETAKPNWFQRRGWMSTDTKGPKFNDVLTVSGYDSCFEGDYYVMFVEWPGDGESFKEDCFEPLITDEQLENELSTIANLV